MRRELSKQLWLPVLTTSAILVLSRLLPLAAASPWYCDEPTGPWFGDPNLYITNYGSSFTAGLLQTSSVDSEVLYGTLTYYTYGAEHSPPSYSVVINVTDGSVTEGQPVDASPAPSILHDWNQGWEWTINDEWNLVLNHSRSDRQGVVPLEAPQGHDNSDTLFFVSPSLGVAFLAYDRKLAIVDLTWLH